MTIGNISTATPSSTSYQTPNWYEDLWQASKEGNLDKIKSTIEHSNITLENFPGEFAGCFIITGEKGHKDIIDFFLSLNAIKIIGFKHLVYGLESDSASEFHREIVNTVINFIKSDKESPILPLFRLYDLFRAALAHNRIKLVEVITKFIDPSLLYDALEFMLGNGYIESEGTHYYLDYRDLIGAIISSLTPELSWKIIEMDAGVVNAGSTSHTKVIEAVIKSIDSSFLFNALKSSIEKKHHTEDSSVLGYYKNIIEITIKSLTPELSYEVLKAALNNRSVELVAMMIEFRPLEKFQIGVTIESLSPEHLWEIFRAALDKGYAELGMMIIKSRSPEKLKLAFM